MPDRRRGKAGSRRSSLLFGKKSGTMGEGSKSGWRD
jgi:hypothetical protein